MTWSDAWPAMTESLPAATPQAEEAALVAAARTDIRAFAPLYQRYLGPVYRYCYVRLGDREAAEDATGEVFLKAVAGLPGYRGGSFAAWLYRIARNVVTDSHRRRRRTEPLAAAESLASSHPTPEAVAVAAAEWAALRDALARLPEDQRAVVELRLAGWSWEEIAGALGKSVDAARMLRARALSRLRASLDPSAHVAHETLGD